MLERLARVTMSALLAFPLIAGCAQLYPSENIAVGVDVWYPELKGDVSLDQGVIQGTLVDFDDGIDVDQEVVPNLRARVQAGPVALQAEYLDLDYSSDVLRQTITFGGQTFTASLPVDSTLELLVASVKAKIGLAGLGPVAVGVVVGVNYFDFRGRISALGLSAEETLDSPFPVIGAIATLHQPLGEDVAIIGEVMVTGLDVDAFDVNGRYLDGEARAGLQFSAFKVGVGYRLIDVDVEEDDFVWDFSLGGAFIFGEIAF